jgi:hypothetical protein
MFKGIPLVMAVCSQFVVDPAARGHVGLRMLKACFDGPQDMTISDEAGDSTRTIWTWCGGDTVFSYSMRWVRPLRPVRFGLSVLARRASFSLMCKAAALDAHLADEVLARLGASVLRNQSPGGSRTAVDVATLAAHQPNLDAHYALRPHYDGPSLAWALERAGRRQGYGPVRAVCVRDDTDRVSGWGVYCLGIDKVAEVLQIGALPGAHGDVVDHLLEDASERGAVAVAGRLEPSLVPALGGKRALFHRGNHWMLLHTRNAELQSAVHRGDAFLSRLEGEWCLRFP